MSQVILNARILYKGWLQVTEAEVRTGTGEVVRRELVERGHAVAVLPYDAGRCMGMMIRLPRPAVIQAGGEGVLLEVIAGVIEGEPPEVSVRREALEEAGVRLDRLEPVGVCFSSPGFSTERVHLYLAPYRAADRIDAGGGAPGEHEDILVEELSLAALAAMADGGQIGDMKSLALIQTLRLRRPDLFSG